FLYIVGYRRIVGERLVWITLRRKASLLLAAVCMLDGQRVTGAFGNWMPDAQANAVAEKIRMRDAFERIANPPIRLAGDHSLPRIVDGTAPAAHVKTQPEGVCAHISGQIRNLRVDRGPLMIAHGGVERAQHFM